MIIKQSAIDRARTLHQPGTGEPYKVLKVGGIRVVIDLAGKKSAGSK